MALLTDEQKQIFDTTLPANFDAQNGLLNPQPLQLTENGGLMVSNRLEFEQLAGTFSRQNLNVPHDEVAQKLEEMRSDLFDQMSAQGYQYAYAYKEFVNLDSATPNRYNLYSICWLSNI
jgi:hypothetical protein